MEANNFWLISIDESSVTVSLLINNGVTCSVAAIGPSVNWSEYPDDSFVSAVDESLTEASTLASISDDQEPESAAIILPPFWVGSDGRILNDKLKIIASACKQLDLKPIGFIPNDEAVVEHANSVDGFPASFVLLHLSNNSFTLSLIYLGKIKHRLRRDFEGDFSPSLVESALVDLKTEFTLPPQIFVFGQTTDSVISNLKNFAWVGKKDVETFLHFPDIKNYSIEDLTNIYALAIASQLKLSLSASVDELEKPEVENEVESEDESDTDNQAEYVEEVQQPELLPAFDSIVEVDPSELNFSSIAAVEPDPTLQSDNFEVIAPEMDPITAAPHGIINEPLTRSKSKISLPKIKFNFHRPRRFKLPRASFFILAALPLTILIPFFFTKADVIVYVTPYSFSKNANVTLDSTATSLDLSKGIIPVEKKEFSIGSSASISTTGKKTVGNSAQGEITIYNKQDKIQNISKGAILTDSTGKQYKLVNAVSVAASSSNLDQGIITLGQTKTTVQAADIGPEYNKEKSTQLNFKDFSENIIIAKVTDGITGGTKQDISAVSDADKKQLEAKINEAVIAETNNKVKQDLSSLSGVIAGSIQNKRSRIEYSREVGEEAQTLSATVDASVSVFIFNPDQKMAVIKGLLASESNYSNATIDPNNFEFTFSLSKIESNSATGSLTVTGNASPIVDTDSLKNKIKGKSKNKASDIIKNNVSRAYKYPITTNMPFLDFINPLPFLPQHIKIEVKS